MNLLGLRTERRVLIYLLLDLLAAVLALALGHAVTAALHSGEGFSLDVVRQVQEHTGASTFFLLSNLVLIYVFEGYDSTRDHRHRLQVFKLGVGVAVAALMQMVFFYLLPTWWWGRGEMLVTNVTFAAVVIFGRYFVCLLRPRLETRLNTLIVGAEEPGLAIDEVIRRHPEHGLIYDIVGFLDDEMSLAEHTMPVLGSTRDLAEVVEQQQVQVIIVALMGLRPALAKKLLDLKARGVRVVDMRTLYKHLTGKVPIEYLSDASLVFGPDFGAQRGLGVAVMRVADVFFALVGLTLSAPLILAAAAAVKLESRGPAFFLQERVGLDERPFTIVKLRTMSDGAEDATGPIWSGGASDMRVTRVGRFLRRTRIDELPQFYNVLVGDMAMVGPRPEREPFVSQLKAKIPFYGLRFSVKPGVTGWAQVKYRYGASVADSAEKLRYDLYAIQAMNPVLYLLIILKTVQTVLLRPGS